MKIKNQIISLNTKHILAIQFCLLVVLVPFSSTNAQTTSNLLFKSSFNNGVFVDKTVAWNHHLSGTDAVTNYTFPNDLPGDNLEHFFNYVIGDVDNYFKYANADVVSTIGDDGNATNALYIEFIKDDPNFVSYSRVQYAMYGDILSDDPVQRMNKGYVKYKIKTHLDHNDLESDWRLPIEWKDMDDDGFRMGLYMYDTNTTTPYWVVKGQYMIKGELGDDIWEYQNYEIPVIEDDWFELEVYWYGHPDPNVGKLKVAINNQVLFDVTNQTKDANLPDKMFYFMPFKVYGAVGYSWITDFEYWDNSPSNSILHDALLALEDEIMESDITVYPNPTSKFLTLPTDFIAFKYQIITITGQLIKQGAINNRVIDVSDLENGVYLLKNANNAPNTNHYIKFIKK